MVYEAAPPPCAWRYDGAIGEVPSFGNYEADANYVERPGAYAIIIDERDGVTLVLAVKNARGALFLPGGGIEAGEDEVSALQREILEETGFNAEIGEHVCHANEYTHAVSEATHFLKVGSFYRATLVSKDGSVTPEHDALFVSLDDFAAQSREGSHVHAVQLLTT